jgi:hypothetical protein
MSSWGNKDDIASPGTVALSGLTVTGTGTFFANNYAAGDIITIADAGGDAVIGAITNETSLTLVSNTELTSGTLTGKAYTVSEKPIYVIDTDTNMDGADVYGVSTAELDGGGGVATIATTAAGTGFTVRPTISITGDGSGATATAVAKVVAIAIGDAAGTGYANGDTITVTGGTGTSATATVTTGADDTIPASLTLVNAGAYTALPTLDEAATTNDGSGDDALTVDLTMGVGAITVTAAGSDYTSAAVAVANTGGNGGGATATATLQSSDRQRVAHAGWVNIGDQYVDANGNTRQKTETLVAMSTITADGDDDTGDVALPE